MGWDLPRTQNRGSLPFRRWYISTTLERLRIAAGLSREQAANRVTPTKIAPSAVYRAESGESLPRERTIRDLCHVYGADDQADALAAMRREPDSREWWQSFDLPGYYGLYISCESQARTIHNYETEVIPGLLQTEAYATAIIRSTLLEPTDDVVRERAEIRMRRREIVNADNAPELFALVDESALHRPVGGAAVMRDQLRALLELPRTATLRILPSGIGGHVGVMAGSFTVLQIPAPAPVLVFTENTRGQSVVDGDSDLAHYADMWEQLASLALSPEDSTALIADVAKKIK